MKKKKDNTLEMIKEYQETGCLVLRNKIVEQNMGLAHRYARKFKVEVDDLIQQASIGLITAIERFDLTLGYRFSTYAAWQIKHEVTKYRRQNAGIISFVDKGRPYRKIYQHKNELEHSTMSEIKKFSNKFDVPVHYIETFCKFHYTTDVEDELPNIKSQRNEVCDKLETDDFIKHVFKIINRLPQNEYDVVSEVFLNENNHKDAAKNLNISTKEVQKTVDIVTNKIKDLMSI